MPLFVGDGVTLFFIILRFSKKSFESLVAANTSKALITSLFFLSIN